MIRLCLSGYCLARPEAILLIVPFFFLLWFLVRKNFIKFKSKEEKKQFNRKKRNERALILLSRTTSLLLLLVALATPYSEKSITVDGDASLTILADNSTSFEIFEQGIAEQLALGLKDSIPVSVKHIAAGDRSAIGDGILNSMNGDDNLLVISDGHNNHGRVLGDVVLFASGLNTSISTLNIQPKRNDAYVKIHGPREAIVGEENVFVVEVSEIGVNSYSLNIEVDGERIVEQRRGKTQEIVRRFPEGYHTITAEITANDHFPQNNIYYKTVKVIPKPKVLFVSEKTSPLLHGLNEIYDIRLEDSLPSKISGYHAVIINDIHGQQLSSWIGKLTEYVAEGNGLIVIGGDNSYDRGFYQNPEYLIESLLPVKIGLPEMSEQNKANIVFLIDVSDTTGLPFKGDIGYSVLDMEKAIATGLIDTLRPEDRVGVIALHGSSTLVSPLVNLGEDKETLKLNIRRMQPGGGTNFVPALRRASFLMEGVDGTKNIILITDGIEYSTKTATLSTISLLQKTGVTVHTVGIGQYTDEAHLKRIAELGDGLYFKPDEQEQLNLVFQRGAGDEEDQKEYKMIILDKNHWITKEDIALDGYVTGYNHAVPKLGARAVVATANSRPLITAGNFGLGRVVAVSTDDGSKWAADFLKEDNSNVIIRAINYAIGDPGRVLDYDVSIDDTPVNKPTQIRVRSENPPKSEIDFSKIGDNMYVASYQAEQTGIQELLGAKVAVNYNDEFLNLGMNPEFIELVGLTKGKVFEKGDIAGIVDTIKTISKRVKIENVNYRWPFIIAALLILLSEIIIRRAKQVISWHF